MLAGAWAVRPGRASGERARSGSAGLGVMALPLPPPRCQGAFSDGSAGRAAGAVTALSPVQGRPPVCACWSSGNERLLRRRDWFGLQD